MLDSNSSVLGRFEPWLFSEFIGRKWARSNCVQVTGKRIIRLYSSNLAIP